MASNLLLQRIQSVRSLPAAADFAPGSGPSTAQLANPGVSQTAGSNPASHLPGPVVFPSLHGTLLGQPVAAWGALILLLLAVKWITEKNGDAAEFRSLRVGFYNISIVTIMAIIGLTIAKWVFGYFKLPGITPVVLAA